MQRKTNTGTWTNWKLGTTAKSALFAGSPGNTYYWRSRARDRAGNVGAWSSEKKTIVPLDDGAFKSKSGFSGFSSNALSAFYRGTVRFSTNRGDSISYTFTGKSVALISTKASNRSKAKVYIDGVYKTTVNPYAASTKYRQVLYSKAWASSGTHTIKFVNIDNRVRFDVDGIAVGR